MRPPVKGFGIRSTEGFLSALKSPVGHPKGVAKKFEWPLGVFMLSKWVEIEVALIFMDPCSTVNEPSSFDLRLNPSGGGFYCIKMV